jgi:hypothetical protein
MSAFTLKSGKSEQSTRRARRRRWSRGLFATVLAVSAIVGVDGRAAVSAGAAGSFQLLGEGLDSCVAPPAAQMANFWNRSPYNYWGVYIGGDQRACAQPNLTASWIKTVTSGSANGIPMAWKLLPLWVGPQDPCEAGFGSYLSLDPSTATSQGRSEAVAAYKVWTGTLGQSSDTPIVYDMEVSSGTITPGCRAAIKSFINGWDYQLHRVPAQKAGVYTSTCAGDIDAFSSIANVPDFIDAANYSSGRSTGNLPCVSSTHWTHQQRHKQYAGSHDETWHGTKINVDSRCANSWVYATHTAHDTSKGCG